jgi:hypothetical protein
MPVVAVRKYGYDHKTPLQSPCPGEVDRWSALLRLRDRNDLRIKARWSEDEGQTWGPEVVVRDNYHQCHNHDVDLGYVSMVQRTGGRLVAVYYWATKDLPEQHIAATIWEG